MVGRPMDVLRGNFVEVAGEKQEAKKRLRRLALP